MSDNKNIKYTDRINTREYNTFTEEYYAGADVTLRINGKEVTSVSSLSYTVQEQQRPIYGYASRVFDDMAIGSRIVIGTLKVPIVNNGKTTDFVEKVSYVDDQDSSNDDKSATPSWANVQTPVQDTSEKSIIYYNTHGAMARDAEDTNTRYDVGEITSSYDDRIKQLQAKLKSLGYDIEVTGYNNTKTQEALSDWQEKNNITSTGNKLDEYTYIRLIGAGSLVQGQYTVASEGGTSLKVSPYNDSRTLGPLLKGQTFTGIKEYKEYMLGADENNTVGYVAKFDLTVVK